MGIEIKVSVDTGSRDKLYLFAESQAGVFGRNVGTGTSSAVSTSSNYSQRVVAVPLGPYYCEKWENMSSGATSTNYGLLTYIPPLGGASQSDENRAVAADVTGTGPVVTISDEYGSHDGTPSTTGQVLETRSVLGVMHKTTNSGHTFTGWKVVFQRSTNGEYSRFLSDTTTVATTANETIFPSRIYDAGSGSSITNYAVVLQLGDRANGNVSITALYDETEYTVYFTNSALGGSHAVIKGTRQSGIFVPYGPIAGMSSALVLTGWLIQDKEYKPGEFFYPPEGTQTTDIYASPIVTNSAMRTLSYVSQYGSPPKAKQYEYNTSAVLDSATDSMVAIARNEGWNFLGWQLGSSGGVSSPGSSFIIKEDTQATAIFNHVSVSVEYYSGFPDAVGVLLRRVVNLNYGRSYRLDEYPQTAGGETYTRPGYSFLGWKVTYQEGIDVSSKICSPGEDITLYAKTNPITAIAIWSAINEYVIHYETNQAGVKGVDIHDVFVAPGTQTQIYDPSLWSLEGFRFLYWQIDGTNHLLSPGDYFLPDSDTVLNAIWDTSINSIAQMDYMYSQGNRVLGVVNYEKKYEGYQFYFSTSVPTLDIVLEYEYLSGYVGMYNASNSTSQSFKTKTNTSPIEYNDFLDTWVRTGLGTSYFSEATPRQSTRSRTSVIIPQDDDTQLHIYEGNSILVDSAHGQFVSYESTSSTVDYINKNVTDVYRYYKLKSPDFTDNEKFTAPDVAYYIFKGWYCLNENVEDASWSVEKVRFSHRISRKRSVSLKELIRCNYIVTENEKTANGEVQHESRKYAIPIRLVYQGIPITVVYDAAGGVCKPFYRICRYGEYYGNLPTPTNGNATFLGWFSALEGGDRILPTTRITNPKEHSIYAHWSGKGSVDGESLVYTVHFIDLLGENPPKSRVFQRGIPSNLPWVETELEWNVPQGYFMDEDLTWNTSSSLVGTFYANGMIVTDITPYDSIDLYIAWKPRTCMVQFSVNEGAEVSPEFMWIPYGSRYGTLPRPTLVGSTFTGWYREPTYITKVTTSSIVTSSHTLYAQWRDNEDSEDSGETNVDWGWDVGYIIEFEMNGGVLDSSYIKQYQYGIEKTLPTSAQIVFSGHTFLGWYTDPGFSGEPVMSILPGEVGVKTFYAKWS